MPRAARARKRRWLFRAAAVAGVLTLVAGAFCWRPIAARVATSMALREMLRIEERWPKLILDSGLDGPELRARMRAYEPWWRLDLLDRGWLVERWPSPAVGRGAAPQWALVRNYAQARFTGPPLHDSNEMLLRSEVAAWFDALLPVARSREDLVEALTGDWTVLPDPTSTPAGLQKRLLCLALFGIDADSIHWRPGEQTDKDYQRWESLCLALVRESHWQAIVREAAHEREKVRAGALLLLFRHPDRSVHRALATKGRADPSPWVRLAAAGTLALRGDPAGADHLLEGLRHERWEVRWWSLMGLAVLEDSRLPGRLAEAAGVETDEWLKNVMERLARKLEEGTAR